MELLKSNIGWKIEKMKIHEGIGQKNKQKGYITQSLLREPVDFLCINRSIYLHVIIFYTIKTYICKLWVLYYLM